MALSLGNSSEPIPGEPCLAGAHRNEVVPGKNPRQHPSQVTSFLDLSTVYGESLAKADALREFQGGRLLTNAQNMLPTRCADLGVDMATGGKDLNSVFCAGDVRANENVQLSAFHALWMREHNRIAGRLAAEHPSWSDQELYQKSRALTIATYQNVVMYEFLPLLLGRDFFESSGLATYPGYDPDLNPGFFAESSMAIFRLGHPRLTNRVLYQDTLGQMREEGLINVFFEPGNLQARGLAAWFQGMSQMPANRVGPFFPSDLIDTPDPLPSLHLFAADCARSRDHGLIDFASLRDELGIPVTYVSDITQDSYNQMILGKYASLTDVDLFVGAILESHAPGSPVGPTVQRVMTLQAQHLRNGDRFWFENPDYTDLTPGEKANAREATMAKLVLDNTGLSCVPESFFEMPWRSDALCLAPGGYVTRPANQWFPE